MSAPNNNPARNGTKKVENPEVRFLMAGNHLDLGVNGLAGSRWATPGVTYGFKKEVLIQMAADAAEEKRLEALEIAQKAEGTSNAAASNTATTDTTGKGVDAPSSNS